ncbi:MAG: hypothetical protein JNL58_13905 [Planctomyces sp.]|nr:hypothetical protein [Planctomyces sp.]
MNSTQRLRAALFVAVCALGSVPAMAHPGHGDPVHSDGVMHFVTSPTHWVPIAIVLGLAALVAVQRFSRSKPSGKLSDK